MLEYEKIFQKEKASQDKMIEEEGEVIMNTVMALFNAGIVVGEFTLDQDMSWKLNPERKPLSEPIAPKKRGRPII